MIDPVDQAELDRDRRESWTIEEEEAHAMRKAKWIEDKKADILLNPAHYDLDVHVFESGHLADWINKISRTPLGSSEELSAHLDLYFSAINFATKMAEELAEEAEERGEI